MFTRFMDMHSGGDTKEPPYEYIYIEAPQSEAEIIFYNRFGHNPNRVTCTCCGEDYSISEEESLEQATGFERNCEYGPKGKYVEKLRKDNYGRKYQTLAEYLENENVLLIKKEDTKPEEREGDVPEQGYVWKD